VKVVLWILIGVALIALAVVVFTVGRLVIGDGPPTCEVSFDSGNYDEAVRFEAKASALDYGTEFEGRQGSGQALVVSVKDDDLFFYVSAADLRRDVNKALIGYEGASIASCLEGKLEI